MSSKRLTRRTWAGVLTSSEGEVNQVPECPRRRLYRRHWCLWSGLGRWEALLVGGKMVLSMSGSSDV